VRARTGSLGIKVGCSELNGAALDDGGQGRERQDLQHCEVLFVVVGDSWKRGRRMSEARSGHGLRACGDWRNTVAPASDSDSARSIDSIGRRLRSRFAKDRHRSTTPSKLRTACSSRTMDEEDMPQPDVSFWGALRPLRARAAAAAGALWAGAARSLAAHSRQPTLRSARRRRRSALLALIARACTRQLLSVTGGSPAVRPLVRTAGMVVKPGKKSKTTIPESVQLHISAVRITRVAAR
jgi:hypothetical protein